MFLPHMMFFFHAQIWVSLGEPHMITTTRKLPVCYVCMYVCMCVCSNHGVSVSRTSDNIIGDKRSTNFVADAIIIRFVAEISSIHFCWYCFDKCFLFV